jgi:hypothetical protein
MSVDPFQCRRIRVYLCLYAFVVQFPDDLLNDASLISERALLLTRGDGIPRVA